MMFSRYFCLTCIVSMLLSCFSLRAEQYDYPLKGEGVFAFLRRHNRAGEVFYAEFLKINKDRLGKNGSLLKGVKYIIPEKFSDTKENSPETVGQKNVPEKKPAVKRGKEPLFGKLHEEYDIIDNSLGGAEFYLVSGHGGPDCGAVARVNGHELHEDEYAYDIVLRLAKKLLQHGASVKLIIEDRRDGIRDGLYLNNGKSETCMGKEIPLSQKKRLRQRIDKINGLSSASSARYKRAIFIHLDSRSHRQQLDVFFYYQSNVKASYELAENMRRTFRTKYEEHQPGRGFSGTVTTRSLAVLKNTVPASIFVELANMQNVNDQKRYIIADNRQALANWLALGFIRDYNQRVKKP